MTTLTENQTTRPTFQPKSCQQLVGVWGGCEKEKANSFELALTWKQLLADRFWKHIVANWQCYGSRDTCGFPLIPFWWAVLGSNQ